MFILRQREETGKADGGSGVGRLHGTVSEDVKIVV